MKKLYGEVIKLRNRLSNDGSGEIYEEDHLLLDEVLDVLEKEIKNESERYVEIERLIEEN